MKNNIKLALSATGAFALLGMGIIGATEATATTNTSGHFVRPTVPAMVTGVTATGSLTPATPMKTGVTVTASLPPSVEPITKAVPGITGPAPLPREEHGLPGKNSGSGNPLPGL